MFHYKLRNSWWIFLILLSVFLSGCSEESELSKSEKQPVRSEDSRIENYQDKSRLQQEPYQKPLPNPNIQKQMVYHAMLEMVVTNTEFARKEIEKHASQLDAYLIRSYENQSSDVKTSQVTYRVPKEKFPLFLQEVKKLAKTNPTVSIQGNDVTDQLVDLESRLKAKQAMEQRLLDLMKQASQPSDLLAISKQLDTTQSEIEQIKGRLQYLQNRIDYSTVEMTLLEYRRIASNNHQSLLSQMWDSFVTSIGDVIVLSQHFLVFLAGLIPFLAVIAILFFCVRLFLWRKKRKEKNHA
jgi:hypothetical protein